LPQPKRSDADLRATADEHLAYEIEMLYRALAELEALERAKHDGAVSQITKSALFESWAVHSRVLREFLFSRSDQARSDDVLAQDFFNDTEWEDIRPEPSAALEQGARRVGKEIAHLTYTRNQVKPEDRGWPVGPTTHELTTALRLFVHSAPENRLPRDLIDRFEAWAVGRGV
jgi:hypothetical protein